MEEDHNTATIESMLGVESRPRYIKAITDSDIIVFTMGVSPTFFHRESGQHILPKGTNDALALIRNHDFRTTTVAENVANLRAIRSILHNANSSAHIILSVSPIPLTATFEMESAIVADCVSKCIMRASVHELMTEQFPNLSYWPSFEVVRWIAPHIGRVFGTDDGSSVHVDLSLLSIIFETFIEHYSGGAIEPSETTRDAFSHTTINFDDWLHEPAAS